jgi:hypothetical protein
MNREREREKLYCELVSECGGGGGGVSVCVWMEVEVEVVEGLKRTHARRESRVRDRWAASS